MQTSTVVGKWTQRLLVGLLAGLFFFSLFLALTRIYQVDEAQNVFSARILASHWESRYNLWVELWHVWPLAWLASRIQDSVSLLHAARLCMLAVFWINIFLIALNCDLPWKSKKFVMALFGAATLAPLWDYGFEIRHENPLLMFFLLYLYCFRLKHRRTWLIGLLLGALAALMQFITFKAFVYWLPMAALFLVFPPPNWNQSRPRTLLFGSLGFLSIALAGVGVLHLTGRLPYVVNGLVVGAGLSTKASVRFWPWETLTRLLSQTPLLLGVGLAACLHTFAAIRGNWRKHCSWNEGFPETFLVLISILALMVNPAPHPYNLCLFVPFAYILGVRWILTLQDSEDLNSHKAFLLVGLLTFTHVVPFAKTTLRHLGHNNDRQELLVELAETMTDPIKDRVYDAAGLVSSRESIGRQWFLHTLIMQRMYQGQLPSVSQMLQDRPASVIIPNYRFSWLPKQDVDYLQSNYLALADDFLVLGQSLHLPQHQDYLCLQAGRYSIVSEAPDAQKATLAMDGTAIPLPSIQHLAKGVHTFKVDKEMGITVIWLGPTLERLPRVPPGESSSYFFNWY